MKISRSGHISPAKRLTPDKPAQDLTIIILAAGSGRRMKSYGAKSLLTVHNKPIILHQIETIENVFPDQEIIVVTGFEADRVYKVIPKHIRVVENENFYNTNTIRSANIGLKCTITDHVLFVYGDMFFNKLIFNTLTSFSAIAVANSGSIPANKIGVRIIENKVTYFGFDIDAKWSGISFLEGRELELFKKFVYNNNHSRLYFFEGLNYILEKGGSIQAIANARSKLVEIDSYKDLQKAHLIT